MPEVSRFYGIRICLYFDDHGRPHFHAKHGGAEASIAKDTLETLEVTFIKQPDYWFVIGQQSIKMSLCMLGSSVADMETPAASRHWSSPSCAAGIR